MTLAKDKALVVLSGGQDSTTCLYWAINQYGKENVRAITFDYGQRHEIEIQSAVRIAELSGIDGIDVVSVRHQLLSASPLTSDNELDKYTDFAAMEAEVGDKVEKTFVPMRNTLFLTIAANHAVALGACNIVTGICQEDNANYPDCRESFRQLMQRTINDSLGLEDNKWGSIQIHAPLMYLSKARTVKLANNLPGCMEALAYSHTSYDGKYPPTDNNHANLLRAKGFEEAGFPDPLVVRAWREGLMPLPETDNYNSVRP